MKKIVYKSKAIQAVILIVAVCLLLSLWPLRLWKEQEVISGASVLNVTGAIDEETTLLQSIVAQYDHMDTIRLYLSDQCEGEFFFLRILDEQWQQVCEERAAIDYDVLPGYQEIVIDIDMEVGKMYYVILQGVWSSVIYTGYGQASEENMPYMGTMYYDDSSMEGVCLSADYNYIMPLRKESVFVCGVLIVIVSALLFLGVRFYYRKKEDNLITIERAFKWVMNPVVALGTVLCLLGIILGYCSKHLLDNTVFFVSILLLAMILFYGINHSRKGQQPIVTMKYVREHIGDLLQSVFIAGAIAACCEYMNGLYDIHHAVAERKEMLWFSLAVIAMFRWKEIVNLYNVIYLAAAGIFGYHYYQTHYTVEMDELQIQVLRYSVWIAVLLGLIVIRTVIGMLKGKLSKPSWYAALLAAFFALIIIFRNGRWWGVALVVSFTLFYLSYGMWEHKERLLINAVRGVVLQFVWATGYCLLHRPYVSYRFARYPHIFHTVTITAAYLTMVECASAVLLFNKLGKSRKLQDCWKEVTFFGVVSSYMMFTMARTAFFAVGISLLFALTITSTGKGKEKIKIFGKNLGLLILSVVVSLPVTFTVQRTVPALVSDPYLYEIESSPDYPEDVLRGRRLSSKNFMRVGRFIDVFAEKVLGIPEGTFDIYGEIEEYRLTHPIDTAKDMAGVRIVDTIPGVVDASVLVASADYVPLKEEQEENDYTNGRLDIFRSYIEQLNMTGHEEMGAVLKNGEIATHAHNIYLQVAYDHGIFVGVVFILFGIVTFVQCCLYYYWKKETITYAAFPAVVVIAVAIAGLVEWIFHISNPCGFLLMLVITPLVFKNEG